MARTLARGFIGLACPVVAAALAPVAAAQESCIDASYDEPALDRWMYPFNGTPGWRWISSTFGNVGPTADEDFDNRDGQMIIKYETDQEVPTGLGPEAYQVRSLTITLMNDGQHPIPYDPTQDGWETYDGAADPDAGRPLELFGVGFRNGFTAESFVENSPYGEPFGLYTRNAYAKAYDSLGECIDVSNSVREQFDPQVWAVGQIDGVVPGTVIPAHSEIRFEIDVEDPYIQAYLREGLDGGYLFLAVTSLHPAEQQSGLFPTIYNKENAAVIAGIADAARADMMVRIGNSADVNCDGVVDVGDLVDVILAWGACLEGNCGTDVNLDGDVTVQDLVAVILNWG